MSRSKVKRSRPAAVLLAGFCIIISRTVTAFRASADKKGIAAAGHLRRDQYTTSLNLILPPSACFRRQRFAIMNDLLVEHKSQMSTTTRATAAATTTTSLYGSNKEKSFVDEILDALDAMAGVAPFSEADLKQNGINNEDDGLVQRAKEREEQAPPDDALSKKSVFAFFALLGIIPNLLLLAAVMSGVKPFGL